MEYGDIISISPCCIRIFNSKSSFVVLNEFIYFIEKLNVLTHCNDSIFIGVGIKP